MMAVRDHAGSDARHRPASVSRISHFWRWVLALIVLGVILRVLYVVITWGFEPRLDTYSNVQRGLYVWQHNGRLRPIWTRDGKQMADTWWPPVFAYFLALAISLHQLIHLFGLIGQLPRSGVPGPMVGHGIQALVHFLRIVLTVFGVLTVPLTAYIGRHMMGDRVGLVAAALMAVYPPLIYVGASLYPEALFVVLLLSAIVCLIRYAESTNAWWLFAAGILSGLSILTHSDAVPMVLVLMFGAWLAARGRGVHTRRILLAPAVVLLSTILAMAPWTIRNAIELHEFVPVSSSLGPTLAGTYNSMSAHYSARPYRWIGAAHTYPKVHERALKMSSQVAISDAFEHAAIDYIKRHPFSVVQVGFWNSLRLFELTGPEGVGGSEDTAKLEGITHGLTWIGDFSVWIVGLLAIGAFFTKSVRRGRYRWIWLMAPAMYLSVIFITVETPRFRAGVDPFLVLAAAGTLVGIWQARRSSPGARRVGRSPA